MRFDRSFCLKHSVPFEECVWQHLKGVQLSPLSFCVFVFVTSCVCLCVFVSPCALPSPLKGKSGNTWNESVQLSPVSLCVYLYVFLSLCVFVFLFVCLYLHVFLPDCVLPLKGESGNTWKESRVCSAFPSFNTVKAPVWCKAGLRGVCCNSPPLSSLGCSKTSQADFWVLGVNFGFVGIFHCQL